MAISQGISIGIGNPQETFKTNPIKALNPSTHQKAIFQRITNKIMEPFNEANAKRAEYDALIEEEKAKDKATEEAIKQRNEEWEREDNIRKETQEREDTTVQRYIEDAKKAGVNIAAMGVGQAPSGGGITSATGSMDYTKWETKYKADLELLMQTIDQNFQGSEAEKDRISELIGKVISGAMIAGGLKK